MSGAERGGNNIILGWELTDPLNVDLLNGHSLIARVANDSYHSPVVGFTSTDVAVQYFDDSMQIVKDRDFSMGTPPDSLVILPGPIRLVDKSRGGPETAMLSFGGDLKWDFRRNQKGERIYPNVGEIVVTSPAPIFRIGNSRPSANNELRKEDGNIGELLYQQFASQLAKYKAAVKPKDEWKIDLGLARAHPLNLFLCVLEGAYQYSKSMHTYPSSDEKRIELFYYIEKIKKALELDNLTQNAEVFERHFSQLDIN